MVHSPSSPAHRSRVSAMKRAWFFAGGILAIGCILAGLQAALSQTSLTNATYTWNGATSSFDFPLRIPSAEPGDISLKFDLHVSTIHAAHYYILVDDCLQQLTINGAMTEVKGVPYCDSDHPHSLDLGPYLKNGKNTVGMVVHNNAGDIALTLRPAFSDIVTLLPFGILLLAVISAGVMLATQLQLLPWQSGTAILLLTGIIMRTAYMLSSPFTKRNHDADAHLEYIRYLHTHVSIPRPDAGWEFWQPPLYYFFGSVWMFIASLLGLKDGQAITGLQVMALLFSIATLLLCAWVAFISIPKKERPLGVPLFVGFFIFFPGLILQASQINNDTLSIALAFASFALLLYWWKQKVPSIWSWLAISLVLSLGILTKSTALLMLAVTFATLFFRKGITWKKKIGLGLLLVAVVTVVAGWFTVYRIVQNTGQSYITGNTSGLNGGLKIPNTLPMYITFNPLAVVHIPYNSAWDDATRRQYFWEYFYRSAFFGEFNYGDNLKVLASWILVLSYAMAVLFFIGLWKTLRTFFYESIPFYLLLLALAAGAALNRFQYPFTPSQDFRYSMGLLLAVAYFSTMGAIGLRQPLLRYAAIIVFIAFITACAMFQCYA